MRNIVRAAVVALGMLLISSGAQAASIARTALAARPRTASSLAGSFFSFGYCMTISFAPRMCQNLPPLVQCWPCSSIAASKAAARSGSRIRNGSSYSLCLANAACSRGSRDSAAISSGVIS